MKRLVLHVVLGILLFSLIMPPAALAQGGGTGGTGAMQGYITDRHGNPVANANVTLNSGYFGDATPWTITDANGMYIFSSINLSNSNIWRITVVVEYAGYPDFQARSEYKTVYDGQLVSNDIQFLNYPPSGRGSLYGVITSGPDLDSPWYEGVVYLTPISYPGVTLFAYVDVFPNGEPAYYSFDHLPVGTYSVRGQHNTLNNQTLYSETITGVEIDEDRNVFLQVYVPYSPISVVEYPEPMPNSVRGYVTCEDGETPIINVNVSVQKSTTATFYTQVAMAFTDENGYYNLTDISVEGIRETFRTVMTYELENQTYSWTSPDFYLYNSYSYGDNANHVQVFDRSLDVNLTGYAHFVSTPPNATVYINGQSEGSTPCTITLAEGVYEYVIELSSYANQTGTVNVVRYQTSEINVTMLIAAPTTSPGPGGDTTLLTVGIISIVIIIVIASVLLAIRLKRKRGQWQNYPGYHQQPPDGQHPGLGPGGYYGPPGLPPYDPQSGYQQYERGHYNIEQYGQQEYYPAGRALPQQYPQEHPDAHMGYAERRPSYQLRESTPVHEMGQGFTREEQDYVLRYIIQNPGGVSFVQMSRDLDIPMNVLTLITKELVINGLVEKEKGNYYPKTQTEQVDSSSVMVWRDDY